MTINPSDFRNKVIVPALVALESVAGIPVSKFAADLLMATAAMESDLGTWLTQVGGPAMGVFQIELASLQTLLSRLTPSEMAALKTLATPQAMAVQIDTNLTFAAAICRLFYWQVPEPLPATETIDTLWSYYKTYYNTNEGSATMADFVTSLKLTDIPF